MQTDFEWLEVLVWGKHNVTTLIMISFHPLMFKQNSVVRFILLTREDAPLYENR